MLTTTWRTANLSLDICSVNVGLFVPINTSVTLHPILVGVLFLWYLVLFILWFSLYYYTEPTSMKINTFKKICKVFGFLNSGTLQSQIRSSFFGHLKQPHFYLIKNNFSKQQHKRYYKFVCFWGSNLFPMLSLSFSFSWKYYLLLHHASSRH